MVNTVSSVMLGVIHKLHHGLTRGSRVKQMGGGGVIRLRYDMIYEQIHLKKTPENSLRSNDDFV